MAGINEWVRQIIVVLVLTGLVELALPGGTMRRYIQVVLGLLILLTVIRPVLGWLDREPADLLPAWQRVLQQASAADPVYQANPPGPEDWSRAQERSRLLALEVHRQRLARIVRDEVREVTGLEPVAVDLSLITDPRSPRWGAVSRVTIHLPGRWAGDLRPLDGSSIRPVEPVQIGPAAGDSGDTARPLPDHRRRELANRLQQAVGARLDLPAEAVIVRWEETVEGR